MRKKGVTMKINIDQSDFGALCICAIRYCHGRQTYMPSLIQGIVGSHLDKFSDKDLAIMLDDCGFQERMHLYGDEIIDKPGWIKWRGRLVAEKVRRMGNG